MDGRTISSLSRMAKPGQLIASCKRKRLSGHPWPVLAGRSRARYGARGTLARQIQCSRDARAPDTVLAGRSRARYGARGIAIDRDAPIPGARAKVLFIIDLPRQAGRTSTPALICVILRQGSSFLRLPLKDGTDKGKHAEARSIISYTARLISLIKCYRYAYR